MGEAACMRREGPSAFSGGGRECVRVKRVCVCFGGVCWGVSVCFERRVCNNGPARPTHLLLGTVVWREAMVVLSVMLIVMFPGCAPDVKNSQCQFALTSCSDQLNLNSEIGLSFWLFDVINNQSCVIMSISLLLLHALLKSCL